MIPVLRLEIIDFCGKNSFSYSSFVFQGRARCTFQNTAALRYGSCLLKALLFIELLRTIVVMVNQSINLCVSILIRSPRALVALVLEEPRATWVQKGHESIDGLFFLLENCVDL